MKHSALISIPAAFLAASLCSTAPATTDDKPDARAILAAVRAAQTAQNQTIRGHLRNAGKTIPFQLVAADGTLKWQFTNPSQTIQLHLLEKDSRLEEIEGGVTKKIGGAKFDDKVRGTDISYEDLAFKFLYWPNAKVEGDQIMILRKCWIIHTEPPAKSESQYSRVMLWIDEQTGALMQAEAYGHDGKLARRFKVISPQKIDGAWMLKQMRIEQMTPTRSGSADREPTYLEVDGVEK